MKKWFRKLFQLLSPEEAKELGYTNYACLYGVAGYSVLEEEDCGFKFVGKNFLGNFFFEFYMWLDVAFEINEGFPLYQGPEL